jgi:hypothetical protein
LVGRPIRPAREWECSINYQAAIRSLGNQGDFMRHTLIRPVLLGVAAAATVPVLAATASAAPVTVSAAPAGATGTPATVYVAPGGAAGAAGRSCPTAAYVY